MAEAPRFASRAVVALAACGVLAMAGCSSIGLLVPQNRILDSVFTRGAPSRPTVALTFDDGPNGACTADVLDALAETGVKATFFVLGHNAKRGGNGALLARMVRDGHEVAVHGWRHDGPRMFVPFVLEWDLDHAARDILASERKYGIADPPPLRFYRPPYGFLNSGTARVVSERGWSTVLWTVSVGDWRPAWTVDTLTEAILARATPGAVIVLHDGNQDRQLSQRSCVDRALHADVVRRLVPRLRERGLEVAPLDEVLGFVPAPKTPCEEAPVLQSPGRSGPVR